MRKETTPAKHRIALKDLLLGQSPKGLGDINRSLRSANRGGLKVYDPEVKFITLSNSLQIRSSAKPE